MLASAAAGLSLLGVGVHAAYIDSASATQNVNVAASNPVACQVSSTDPSASPLNTLAHSVTFTPAQVSGSAGSAYIKDLTVKNTGQSYETVYWSVSQSGDPKFQVASDSLPLTQGAAITLAPGASQTYGTSSNLGLSWSGLTNSDLTQTASATWTANCTETASPPPPLSKIQFVGVASHSGNGALTFPAGTQSGDVALVLEAGTSIVATPSGYTNIAVPVAPRNNESYEVVGNDTALPAAASTVTDMQVAVYRGVSGIGSHTYFSGNSNQVGLSGGSPLYYPLKSQPLDGVSGPAMIKTDGSSWVVNMGFDAYASTNMNQLSFNKIISSSPTPYVMDGVVAPNRPGNTDAHMGLADTNGGVAAWAGGAWTSPGDNFPLPNSHGVTDHVIELLSK